MRLGAWPPMFRFGLLCWAGDTFIEFTPLCWLAIIALMSCTPRGCAYFWPTTTEKFLRGLSF